MARDHQFGRADYDINQETQVETSCLNAEFFLSNYVEDLEVLGQAHLPKLERLKNEMLI